MGAVRVLLAWVVVLLVFPIVHAGDTTAQPGISNPTESTPTKLYFHLGANQDFPVNTQKPEPPFQRDDHAGVATSSLNCVPSNPVTDSLTQKRYTTYYGFSSPSYVEYNYSENGSPRIFPERGFSYDIHLDPAVAPSVDWYLTTFAGAPSGNIPNVDPVLPNVVDSVMGYWGAYNDEMWYYQNDLDAISNWFS